MVSELAVGTLSDLGIHSGRVVVRVRSSISGQLVSPNHASHSSCGGGRGWMSLSRRDDSPRIGHEKLPRRTSRKSA